MIGQYEKNIETISGVGLVLGMEEMSIVVSLGPYDGTEDICSVTLFKKMINRNPVGAFFFADLKSKEAIKFLSYLNSISTEFEIKHVKKVIGLCNMPYDYFTIHFDKADFLSYQLQR